MHCKKTHCILDVGGHVSDTNLRICRMGSHGTYILLSSCFVGDSFCDTSRWASESVPLGKKRTDPHFLLYPFVIVAKWDHSGHYVYTIIYIIHHYTLYICTCIYTHTLQISIHILHSQACFGVTRHRNLPPTRNPGIVFD